MALHDYQQQLLRVLDERDIAVNAEDVAKVFESAQTRDEAISWTREYLTPATLLSKDELRHHETRSILTPDGNKIVRPFCSDAEVEIAIKSIEASTAAIEEQCKLLESQKLALRDLHARNARQAPASASIDSQQKNLERQRAHVDFSIDELSQSLAERIRLASGQAESLAGRITSNADRLFDKDDRLLDGLQKLLPILSRPPVQTSENVDVDSLCSTLTLLSAQEIRAQLNAAYVDSLAKFGPQIDGAADVELSAQQQKQRETLRTELAELSGEIDGLVGIVVDHCYRNPIRNTQNTAQADTFAQRASWSEYLIVTLQYLTARLDKLNEHVQHIHAHRAALQAISTSLDEVSAMQAHPLGAAGANGDRKSIAKGLKPLRLVQANLSELQDPAIQLLRQLDIRTSDIDKLAKPEESLDPVLRGRNEKLVSLIKSTETSVTDTITKSLSASNEQLQALLEATHAYSSSGSINLVDGTIVAALQSLESNTQRIGEEMRELDTDNIARFVKAKQADVIKSIRH